MLYIRRSQPKKEAKVTKKLTRTEAVEELKRLFLETKLRIELDEFLEEPEQTEDESNKNTREHLPRTLTGDELWMMTFDSPDDEDSTFDDFWSSLQYGGIYQIFPIIESENSMYRAIGKMVVEIPKIDRRKKTILFKVYTIHMIGVSLQKSRTVTGTIKSRTAHGLILKMSDIWVDYEDDVEWDELK